MGRNVWASTWLPLFIISLFIFLVFSYSISPQFSSRIHKFHVLWNSSFLVHHIALHHFFDFLSTLLFDIAFRTRFFFQCLLISLPPRLIPLMNSNIPFWVQSKIFFVTEMFHNLRLIRLCLCVDNSLLGILHIRHLKLIPQTFCTTQVYFFRQV